MEDIVVFVIVGIGVVLMGWLLSRILAGGKSKKSGCSCNGNCDSCSNAKLLKRPDKK